MGCHGAGAVIFRDWLFVDLVNTVSRDTMRSQSNQILLRAGTTFFTLKMWVVRFCRATVVTQLLAFLAASLHPSTSELPGDLQALRKATLVVNEGGDDWSPWNVGK
jgi:hypothetical protein